MPFTIQRTTMIGKVGGISVLVIALALYFWLGDGKIRDGKVLTTGSGEVKGSIGTSRDGRDYYAWHQIPYAKPPVGSLRFADPLPIDSWSKVIDGREEGPKCAQVNFIRFEPTDVAGLEDCLHINVYAPKQLHDEIIQGKQPKKPVLVYIHAGAYVAGSSRMGTPGYFMDEDVIFVSFQYRLDILGFLTTGDKIARGNQGLKDQTMALQWIKKNIEHFGGDPNQIMILGNSAGAASVHQQMLSPLSKGLFQKAYSQSGAASNTWGLITLERSLEKTKEAAATFNCPVNDNQQLVDCLRNVELETLLMPRLLPLQGEYGLFNPHMYGEGFNPIVEAVKDEKTFLGEHPLKIISDGRAHRVPYLVGHTTHEGLYSTGTLMQDSKNLDKFESEIVPAIKMIFAIENQNADEIARKIQKFYVPNKSDINFAERAMQYVHLFGDGFFNFDIHETVRLQRSFSPVYFYLQNNTDIPDFHEIYVAISWKRPFWLDVAWALLKSFLKDKILGVPPKFYGVNHAADALFLFPLREFSMEISKNNKLYQYSKDFVKLAVQFVKDDSNMKFRGVEIPPVPSEGPLKVVEFKPQGVVISPEPFTDRMEFLRSLKIRPNYGIESNSINQSAIPHHEK